MLREIRILTVMLNSLLLVLLASVTQAEVTIELYDAVFVTYDKVYLSDVASLSGAPDEIALLKNLPVVVADAKATRATLTREELKQKTGFTFDLSWAGAPAVEIHFSDYQNCTFDLASIIQRRWQAVVGDSLEVRLRLTAEDNPLEVKETAPKAIKVLCDGRLLPGNQVTSLEYLDSLGRAVRKHVQVNVTLFGILSFPARLIKRGEIIKSTDLITRTVDLKESGVSGLVLQSELLPGLEAARHLTPQSAIRWDQICLPPTLRKGDKVALVFSSPGIEIKTEACALEDGTIGQNIWIKLENNGKRLRAVVVDQNHVIPQ